jgi:hypothetical protein
MTIHFPVMTTGEKEGCNGLEKKAKKKPSNNGRLLKVSLKKINFQLQQQVQLVQPKQKIYFLLSF